MKGVGLPRTLTARLVVTAVALVALVSLLIAGVSTVAIRASLMDRLDADVLSALGRVDDRGGRDGRDGRDGRGGRGGRGDGHDGDRGEGGPAPVPAPTPSNQGPGTLIAVIDPAGGASGFVLTRERGGQRSLGADALARLAAVPRDERVHSVSLTRVGDYRVAVVPSASSGWLISGLPTREVDETVTTLVGYELLLVLLGLAAAAVVGTVVVRRQLRPLHEVAQTAHAVAALPLDSGAIDLTERVPDRLTDERTEVGQMGSALNTLLAHVESSLEARHRSEQQVRQFVADASHELRTPLATIQGYAELSRRTPQDAAALTAALAKVETEAGRMSGLVEDLLLLARLDAGRPLESSEVDLTRLLLEAAADIRVLAPDHVWRLDLPAEPVTVPGDERRLHQVVSNLLGNARQHTPPGTTVTLVVRSRPGTAELTVHDDGPGLPAGLVPHAFERFTRGDTARTRSSGGVGLGLSLVAAIAQAHGGSATVQSVPGATTFTVSLPTSLPTNLSTSLPTYLRPR